jgi:hypothetical protein
MRLTKAEADLLLPIGTTEFAGTVEELGEEIQSAIWVWDDAPFPYWEKEKKKNVLKSLADKHGLTVSI